MEIDYTGGVLTVTAGMAVDETIDPNDGPLGRELMLVDDSPPVDLTGFSNGDTAWITIQYDSSLDHPKPPTSPTASRVTQKVRIATHHADPGQGATAILLGSILVGGTVQPGGRQTAVLRLGGAPGPATLTGISVTPASPTVTVGSTVTLTAQGSFSDGTTRALTGGDGLTWSSSSAGTATVSAAGVVTGVAAGAVTITATAGGFTDTAAVTVTAAQAQPVIKSIAPTSQIVGGPLTIRGSNIRDAGIAPGSPALGTTVRFVDPGNPLSFVPAAVVTVLTNVSDLAGPQRVQVTVPAKGALPNLVNIVLEIGVNSAPSPQQFTFL
jgi:hypothetical protein